MAKITTLTMNPAIDLFAAVEHVVADEKLRCRDPRRDPGGGGLNVARVVHRLGGEARAVYPAGGHTGALLTHLLQAEGVDGVPVQVGGATRQDFTAYESAGDRQFRFVLPGPELGAADQERLLDAALAEPTDYLVASGSLPPGVPATFYADVASRAREAGARMILDTSEDALREGVQAGVFLVKPNLRELSHLAGREVPEDPEHEQAARELVARGDAEVVVVSLGAGGVLLVTGAGSERIASPTVPIRSKVGAGDSMVGGITLALARGEELATAVRFGVAAGAAAVMTPGNELCRREDVERLFARLRATARRGP